jgi:adenylate kinase
MKLVFLGPPGSGKGTQAEFLKDRFCYISTGDLVRQAIADNNQEIKEYIDKGLLVPDDLVLELLKPYLTDDNWLLDGYPRTLNQARTIPKPDLVLYFKLEDSIAVNRMKARARFGETEDIILQRLSEYHKHTVPLLDHYKDIVYTIDASLSIEEIKSQIMERT